MTGSSNGPGFIFWGLFVLLALWVVLYGTWMRWAERRERESSKRTQLGRSSDQLRETGQHLESTPRHGPRADAYSDGAPKRDDL